MGYTPQEVQRLQRLQALAANPTEPSEGITMEFLLAIFARIVLLRDAEQEQRSINQDLRQRIRALELRLENHTSDTAEVYLTFTPLSEDTFANELG